MWGVFGSRKSLFHACLFDVLIALAVMGGFVGITGVAMWDWTKAMQSLAICGIAGLAAAMIWLVLPRFSGPAEIRDTMWAMLDINGAGPWPLRPRHRTVGLRASVTLAIVRARRGRTETPAEAPGWRAQSGRICRQFLGFW